MLRRVQGKVAFGDLQDMSGRIQLFAPAKVTPEFDSFTSLNIGDWIGVTGEIMKTKRGELSVKVEQWVILASANRPFPDKWHGITDPDLRYRQRYVDLWVTEEARENFLTRSNMLSLTRRWLEAKNFLEVETPVFHPIPGGALARPFSTHHNALDTELYLRIAPELYLKRLVVGGIEKVFEINRNFRNEGLSTKHNPEFTMLEYYTAYADFDDQMSFLEKLFAHLASELNGSSKISIEGKDYDLSKPFKRIGLLESVATKLSIAEEDLSDRKKLEELSKKHKIEDYKSYSDGKLQFELFEKVVEDDLIEPTFIVDYPVEVSPLSRLSDDKEGIVDRFELFIGGNEIANGFSELNDPEDQAQRFSLQLEDKAKGDDEAMHFDSDYIKALEYGMPPTAGEGIGIDRLTMLLTDSPSIRDVLLFPQMRPNQ